MRLNSNVMRAVKKYSDNSIYSKRIIYNRTGITTNSSGDYDTTIPANKFIHGMIVSTEYYCRYRLNTAENVVLNVYKLSDDARPSNKDFGAVLIFFE